MNNSQAEKVLVSIIANTEVNSVHTVHIGNNLGQFLMEINRIGQTFCTKELAQKSGYFFLLSWKILGNVRSILAYHLISPPAQRNVVKTKNLDGLWPYF